MQYFHRAHGKPETILGFADTWFGGRGFSRSTGAGDHARFTDPRGPVGVRVEVEGGHYVRVTVGTQDVGESELDKLAKRFLSELHRAEAPRYKVRGAY